MNPKGELNCTRTKLLLSNQGDGPQSNSIENRDRNTLLPNIAMYQMTRNERVII